MSAKERQSEPAHGWLLKTEPGEYSFADLQRAGRDRWDGVRSPAALRQLRAMVEWDPVVIYHSGRERRAVGWARVAAAAYPDPESADPRLAVVDVTAEGSLAHPVSLAALREEPVFASSPLLRQGRLSVVPLSAEQWARLQELAAGG